MALIERKNEKARELGLDHKWVLDEYDVPDIVEFIENIKRGYVIEHPSLQDEEYEKIVKDMSRGSI